jgi:hypothetical membrane protein
VAALVGIAIYVAIDIALAFLRPDYSLIRNAESDYGRGHYAWLMDVNFVLRGVFSILALIALLQAKLARRWMAALLALWAVTSAALALFPDNPVGYPVLASGSRHLALGAIAFVAIVIATIAMSFWRSGANRRLVIAQRTLSIIGAVAFLALAHPFGAFGLIERIFLAAELAWLVITLVSSLTRLDQK